MLFTKKNLTLTSAAVAALLLFPKIVLGSAGDSIAGGRDVNTSIPYIALVSPEGVATEVTDGETPVGTGNIYSASINSSGYGLVAGADNGGADAYVATVSPEGVLTKLTGAAPAGGGYILGVAVNGSNQGIVGGADSDYTAVYAAIVSPEGVATEVTGAGVPMGNGQISAVTISSSGAGIIAGVDNEFASPYAAVVTSGGVATEIFGAGVPMGGGSIITASINEAGEGMIGGIDHDSALPYAALVSSLGDTTPISGPDVPSGEGAIRAVAINNSGVRVIGGQDGGSSNFYAAFVDSDGVATEMTGLPTAGAVQSMAINSSGVTIIGGAGDMAAPYAAFVTLDNVVTEISGPVGEGTIFSVAIDDSGIGLIGGQDNLTMGNFEPYLAIVAPDGTATEVTGAGIPMGFGEIKSVAFPVAASSIIASFVPKSYGPGSSFATSFFALTSQVLPNHLMQYHGLLDKTPANEEVSFTQEIGLLADASERIQGVVPCRRDFSYSLWMTPFGEYARQDGEQNVPTIKNWIAGVMVGFDYRSIENTVVGLGAAYAFNYAHLSEGTGHAKTNQEFLTLYTSWSKKNFYLNLALWGGMYQMKNIRHSPENITSTSNVDGWLLSPHLEISTPFYARNDWFAIEPFAMFDWANNWQGHVHEHGGSGFNLILGNDYTSILRSEVGFRFYEVFQYQWGNLILEEKGSYVNKKPFSAGTQTAVFVGSASSFGVEVFNGETQNLGAAQFNMEFIPCNTKYPFGSINYQGEFGSSFQSHLVSLEIGWNF